MPCYSPLTGYVSRLANKNGKRPIVFNHRDGFLDLPVQVPCGQCIGCRLERSRQWAIRCVHEASLYDDNCFITLTYTDENLPCRGNRDCDKCDHFKEKRCDGLERGLCKRDFQLFLKRLRKMFGKGVRYHHCGEYGEQLGRPHHHACLFNFNFPDR